MARKRRMSWLAIFTALLLAVIWGCNKPQEQAAVTPPAGAPTNTENSEQTQQPNAAHDDAEKNASQRAGEQGGTGGASSNDATVAHESHERDALVGDVDAYPVPTEETEEIVAAEVDSEGSDVFSFGGVPQAAPNRAAAGHAPQTMSDGSGAPGRSEQTRMARSEAPLDASNQQGGQLQGQAGEGEGPGQGGNQYDYVAENPFVPVGASPLSTFSIDVDTASYSNARMHLTQYGQLPPAAAIRIEEFINYFPYNYAEPEGDHPFSTAVEVATCPWQPAHRLVRVGLQGEHVDFERRPQANLVFLLDVSGSMNDANKLPLVKDAIRLLVGQLNGDDRVAIVVYAGAAGLVLDSTELANGQEVLDALEVLSAGGSTNGGAGIQLAYQVARDNFVPQGINRVILCTDGDFNVGQTSTGGLVETAVAEAKDGVFISVLGFGSGNYNDAMLETISNNANGNCAFIDTQLEARKVMVEQVSGTLMTIAKDVKIQVEFNPAHVYAYRLIGYENRMLRTEDFTDDKKDAGEIGAGHQVTAIYEIVPVGAEDTIDLAAPEELRYQEVEAAEGEHGDELLTVKLRYKLPDGDTSIPLEVPVIDSGHSFGQASEDFRFATCVAAYGMLLKNSQYAGQTNYEELRAAIRVSLGEDPHGYRGEFLHMVGMAQALSPEVAPGDDAPPSGWEARISDETEPAAEEPAAATEESVEESPTTDLPTEETAAEEASAASE